MTKWAAHGEGGHPESHTQSRPVTQSFHRCLGGGVMGTLPTGRAHGNFRQISAASVQPNRGTANVIACSLTSQQHVCKKKINVHPLQEKVRLEQNRGQGGVDGRLWSRTMGTAPKRLVFVLGKGGNAPAWPRQKKNAKKLKLSAQRMCTFGKFKRMRKKKAKKCEMNSSPPPS